MHLRKQRPQMPPRVRECSQRTHEHTSTRVHECNVADAQSTSASLNHLNGHKQRGAWR